MKIVTEASVQGRADDLFALLVDPQQIVGCIPGAALTGREGERWTGAITVKIGPIRAQYEGTVEFADVDHESMRLRLVARGRDVRGSGDAEAEVVVSVIPDGQGCRLAVDTDLLIRGKLAQFGKGAVAVVAERLLAEFARNVGALLQTPASSGTAEGPASPASAPNPAPVASELGLGQLLGSGWPAALRPVVAIGGSMLLGYVVGRAVSVDRAHRVAAATWAGRLA